MKRYISALLVLLMLCAVPCGAAETQAEQSAHVLHQLGLFSGTGSDKNGAPIYDLDRAPTRNEAITMLVALLGKSEQAQSGTWDTPFTDVERWAQPFVGYAYANGLTSGTSETTYGGDELVTASQYITFVLKALGYSSATDFQWDKAWLLSDQLGITHGEYSSGAGTFSRGNLAMISEGALTAAQKGSEQTLAEKLMDAGVFTRSQYDWAYRPSSANSERTALTAQEIGEKCAPAVFYIEQYGMNGALYSRGSGFFISPDGLAVTNYHVVENSMARNIIMPDRTTYTDIDIIAYNKEQDLVLLRVHEAVDVPYLEINIDPVRQGQQVYAIGSPFGLDNTLSQGIISNPSRYDGEIDMIQISVPITHGSSGGALLNEYGQVIGITSAGFGDADLNLAVPAKQILSMDFSSQESYIVYGDDTYAGYRYAYDFGLFSNTTEIACYADALGYYFFYDFFDFHDDDGMAASDHFAYTCYHYKNMLLQNGFEQVWVADDLGYTGEFQKGNEIVGFMVDFEQCEMWIWVGNVPTYYEQVPALPDLGWYIGLDGTLDTAGNSIIYEYYWPGTYSTQGINNLLDYYFLWLEDEGFAYLGGENGAWLFEGNGLSVVCILDAKYVVLDVQRK